MRRREFLLSSTAFTSTVFASTPLHADERFAYCSWDRPWPGLLVNAFRPHDGVSLGVGLYLESNPDTIVRALLPCDHLHYLEQGYNPPTLTLEDIRWDLQEKVFSIIEDLRTRYVQKFGGTSLLPVLVREKALIEVRGTSELLERYGFDIPPSWKKRSYVSLKETRRLFRPSFWGNRGVL